MTHPYRHKGPFFAKVEFGGGAAAASVASKPATTPAKATAAPAAAKPKPVGVRELAEKTRSKEGIIELLTDRKADLNPEQLEVVLEVAAEHGIDPNNPTGAEPEIAAEAEAPAGEATAPVVVDGSTGVPVTTRELMVGCRSEEGVKGLLNRKGDLDEEQLSVVKEAAAEFGMAEDEPGEVTAEVQANIAAAKAPASTKVVAKSEVAKAPEAAPGPLENIVGGTSDDVTGEVRQQDLKVPRLNLVNKSGDLSNDFTPGEFVLSKMVSLGGKEGTAPFEIVAIRMKLEYQQNLEYEDERTSLVFDTEAQVREAGFQASPKKGESNFGRVAHVEIMVPMPENCDEEHQALFADFIEGRPWCRAIYTVKSSAFTGFAGPLLSARATHLKNVGLKAGRWFISSRLQTNEVKGKKQSWWAPKLENGGLTSEAFRAYVDALLKS